MPVAAPPPPASPLGTGLLCTFCTAVLPFVDDTGQIVMRAVTAVQPTFGFATSSTGAVLPSVASGRPLLSGALVCRYSTPRGTLPDYVIPTTVGNYGIDILDSIDADMTPTMAGMLASDLDAQAQQDERVITTTTSATLAGDMLVISQTVTDGTGPFRLTLAINTLAANLTLLSAPT